jgi:methylmalonyl-CoA mutase N-terminal domain/subunit
MEEETYRYFDKISALGGVLKAIEKGFFQQEIANSAYRYQKEIDKQERVIVGVNEFVEEDDVGIPLLEMDPEGEMKQLARLKKLREDRDQSKYESSLSALLKAAEGDENLMPYILDAVRANATLGETCDVLREVFKEYDEPPIF